MKGAIAPIVEGQSEVKSIGILLRRILSEFWNIYDIEIARPFRVKRNRVVRPGELERAIGFTIGDRAGTTAILVLLDADDDDPCQLAKDLFSRSTKVTQLPIAVALARKEFECWILGAKESLRGQRGIRQDCCNPSNPEGIRAAKGWLSRNMESGSRYVEVDDQPAFAATMDLRMARKNCPSFRAFICGVRYLVTRIADSPPPATRVPGI